MRLSRANLVVVLTIVAGGVIGGSLSFGLLGSRSAPDDMAEQVTRVRTREPLEFKLVLPVTELEPALSRIDRRIVAALGVDSIQALSRDVENLLFGGDIDQSLNLKPFTSLLRVGDVEGAFLVATEDVEVATHFLGLTEVHRALPTDVSLHWAAASVDLLGGTYRHLYVTAREAFATGDLPDDTPAGVRIAVVRDGEVGIMSLPTGGLSH